MNTKDHTHPTKVFETHTSPEVILESHEAVYFANGILNGHHRCKLVQRIEDFQKAQDIWVEQQDDGEGAERYIMEHLHETVLEEDLDHLNMMYGYGKEYFNTLTYIP